MAGTTSSSRGPTDKALSFLHLFVAVTAIPPGVAMVISPSGALLRLPGDLLDTTPFGTFFVPGVLLAFVVGGMAVAAWVAWLRRDARFGRVSLFAGATLVGWLLVQLLLIRSLHWLHVVYLGVGVAQVAMARTVLNRPAREATLARVQPDARFFFRHRRIAFVGLSADEASFSRSVAKELEQRNIDVVPVNPSTDDVAGHHSYPRVSEIPDPPRVALIMTPASAAVEVVDDCVKAGVEAVWFHQGAGPGSGTPEAVERARDAGLVVVDGVCPLMFLEPVQWFHKAHRDIRFGKAARKGIVPGCGHATGGA